jgi:SAM-dependent methyltransferase
LNGRDALYKVNELLSSAFGRVGIEFQMKPKPKRKAISVVGEEEAYMTPAVNWLRVPMYRSIFASLTKDFGKDFFKGKSAVEIGGSEGSIKRMLLALGSNVQLAPDFPKLDVEDLPYAPESFDVVVLDQTFEHLKHPWKAVEQIDRVLKKGGVCVCTSVFIYPLHHGGEYGDYYRFSPDGFRALFEGFKVVSSEGWGSGELLKLVYGHSERGPEGTAPISVADAKKIGMYERTDTMNYMFTWCIVQKE